MRAETGFAVIVLLLFGIIAVPLLSAAGFTGSAVSQLNVKTEANMFGLGLLGFILLLGFIFMIFKFKRPDVSPREHKPTMFYNPAGDVSRIKDYIKYAKSKRQSKQQIKKKLEDAGWEDDIIGKAFESLQEE